MPAVVGTVVGRLLAGADQPRVGVQQDRRLQLAAVHVGDLGGVQAGHVPRLRPVGDVGEQRHAQPVTGRLLDGVTQHVVAAVPVDHGQPGNPGAAQRRGDVANHRVQGWRSDAHRAGPGRVLLGAGDRHRRQEMHRVTLGDTRRHGARHQGVGRQRQVRAVLLEAADRKDRDTRLEPVGGGVWRQQAVGGDQRHPPILPVTSEFVRARVNPAVRARPGRQRNRPPRGGSG